MKKTICGITLLLGAFAMIIQAPAQEGIRAYMIKSMEDGISFTLTSKL